MFCDKQYLFIENIRTTLFIEKFGIVVHKASLETRIYNLRKKINQTKKNYETKQLDDYFDEGNEQQRPGY